MRGGMNEFEEYSTALRRSNFPCNNIDCFLGAINLNTVRRKLVLINQTDVSFLRQYLTGRGKQGSSVLKNYANVTIQSPVRMFSVKRYGL